MSRLSEYLDDYAARNPGWRERADRINERFFADLPDVVEFVDPVNCTEEHPGVAGPNMDIAQCGRCLMPIGVMRPDGESFGWHIDDCSLPMRHPGYCKPGGEGHVIPPGWKLRG